MLKYIGELTKFQIADPVLLINCLKKYIYLKRLLKDFNLANIEIILVIVENFGYYLYNFKSS